MNTELAGTAETLLAYPNGKFIFMENGREHKKRKNIKADLWKKLWSNAERIMPRGTYHLPSMVEL